VNPHGALPENLAGREAGEALRWIALAEIERARACRQVLAQGADVDALHDFRVALRRLRSHLRAYREKLSGATRRSACRRLRRIAAATNPGRDAEVGLELIARWSTESSGAESRALAGLGAELERRRDAAYETVRSELLPDFDRAARSLEHDLRRYEIELRPATDPAEQESFRELFARHAFRRGEELLATLGEASTDADEEALHRARIAAKRLRYLAEPLLAELAPARPLLALLKELQDELGSARDAAVLAARLAALGAGAERERLLAVAGGRPARPSAGGRAGRLAVARRIGGERERLGREIGRLWLRPGSRQLAALRAAIAALARELDEPVTPEVRLAPAPAS
jgi:CHAD domain-containing protein